jgi:hypothetical protein
MIICSGVFWELTWWEKVIFVIIFGFDVYLILRAPSSPDLTMEYDSHESTSSDEYSEVQTPTEKIN